MSSIAFYDHVVDRYITQSRRSSWEARLENYRAEEKQYVTILNRSGSISEVLQVTQAISDVRYQIERIEAQLKNYDTRVEYSTINLSLTEDDKVSSLTEKWRPGSTVTDAFGAWIAFLQDALDAGIYLLIFGWPLALIGVVVWWRKRK